jgi:glutamine cyclotransferase
MRHTPDVGTTAMTALGSILVALMLGASLIGAPPDAARPTDEPPSAAVPELAWELVARWPHDAEAWTQGLQLDAAGRLYESTGLLGHSSLREVERESGRLLRSVALPDDVFAEGIAIVDDRIIQLTWKDGLAWSWKAATFEPLDTYRYSGEGWGLCFDGQRLVMSDGRDRLTFRDAATFERLGAVDLVHDLADLRLNELECVAGEVWANAYQTDTIVRIDPASGHVTGLLDLADLRVLGGAHAEGWDVLNGIAYDASADTYLVTGKLWSELFEIRVLEPEIESQLEPETERSSSRGTELEATSHQDDDGPRLNVMKKGREWARRHTASH